MKKFTIFLTSLFILSMFSTIAAPNGIAGINSMGLFLFIEERTIYIINDTVNITVHVFDNSVYITPDNLTVTVGCGATDVFMSELKKGIYEGIYKIKASDAPYGLADIVVTATYGKNDESRMILIDVYESEISEEFLVLAELDDHSDYTAQPGDIVEITVTAKDGDTKVNPKTVTSDKEFTVELDTWKFLALQGRLGAFLEENENLELDVEVLTEYAQIDVLIMNQDNWNRYNNDTTRQNKEYEYYPESQLKITSTSFTFTAPESGVYYIVLDNSGDPDNGAYVTFPVDVHVNISYINLELFTAYWGKGSVPINYINPSTGVFKTSVMVDPTIKEDTILTIGAIASYKGSEDSNYVDIPINFYNVWIHKIYVENTSAKFEIWVSDLEGKAVPGAFVYLTKPESIPKTTNPEGKAEFTVSYEEPEFGDINIVGSIKVGSEKFEKTQTFDTKFYIEKSITPAFQPKEDKFDVFYVWGEAIYEPGDEINRGYVAYNNTELWRNETIYYYAIYREHLTSHSGEIITSGDETTDSNGTFDISFTAPNKEGGCNIYFETATDPSNLTNDGKFYKEHLDPLIIIAVSGNTSIFEDSIRITIDKLVLGGGNTVSVSMSGSSGYLGTLTWEVNDDNWILISGMRTFYLRNSGEEFSGDVFIPEFLPEEVNCTIYVTLIDPVTMEYYINYLVITPSQTAPMGMGVAVIYLAILIIVLALIAIAVIYRWKRRREEESEDLEEELE